MIQNEQALRSCSIKGMEVCFREFIADGVNKILKIAKVDTFDRTVLSYPSQSEFLAYFSP